MVSVQRSSRIVPSPGSRIVSRARGKVLQNHMAAMRTSRDATWGHMAAKDSGLAAAQTPGRTTRSVEAQEGRHDVHKMESMLRWPGSVFHY